MKVKIDIYLEEKTIEELEKLSQKKKLSISRLIENLIENCWENKK